MTAQELKDWRDRLLLTNQEAAALLALTQQAFLDQLYGHRPVSPRTEQLASNFEGLLHKR